MEKTKRLTAFIKGAIFSLNIEKFLERKIRAKKAKRAKFLTENQEAKPKKIKTTDEINSLYILDDNRILEFDKDGKYINQFNFDKGMDNITDFQINPKTKELYIINSGKIYKYSI